MTKRELEYYKEIKRNTSHELFDSLFYITSKKVIMPVLGVTLRLDTSENPVIMITNLLNNRDGNYENIANNKKQDNFFDEKYNQLSNAIASNSKFGNRSIFFNGIKIYEGLFIDKT